MKILHCADLHLTADEKEYSLGVFEEIIDTAVKKDCVCLLLCGDIFSNFEDAEKLRDPFRTIAEKFQSPILYIPGNHEELRKKKNSRLDALDFGLVRLLEKTPFEFFTLTLKGIEVEFIALPHQEDYTSLHTAEIPPKKADFRIALAHGNLPELLEFTGPDEEEGAGIFDAALFQKWRCDYAALGHIHSRRQKKFGDTLISYSGSGRIWRRGEAGSRGVMLLELGSDIRSEFLPLKKPGLYRKIHLPVSFEGTEAILESASVEWSEEDWIDLYFEGIVEDEKKVADLEKTIREKFSSHVRRIDVDRSNIVPFPGIAKIDMAGKFLELWEQSEPESPEEKEVWFRCRILGLEAILQAAGGAK